MTLPLSPGQLPKKSTACRDRLSRRYDLHGRYKSNSIAVILHPLPYPLEIANSLGQFFKYMQFSELASVVGAEAAAAVEGEFDSGVEAIDATV